MISDKMSRLVKVSLRNIHNSFQTTENQEPVYQYNQYSMRYEKKRKNKGKRIVEWKGGAQGKENRAREERKAFVQSHSPVTKRLQEATRSSRTPGCCKCFHFLDGKVCDAICSRERAFGLRGLCSTTKPRGPGPASEVCGQRSPADQPTEPGQGQPAQLEQILGSWERWAL